MFNTLLIFLLSTWINIKIIFLKSEEISRNKMFNPSLLKKKSYYMNFKHKNTSYMPLLVTYVFKVFKRLMLHKLKTYRKELYAFIT